MHIHMAIRQESSITLAIISTKLSSQHDQFLYCTSQIMILYPIPRHALTLRPLSILHINCRHTKEAFAVHAREA